MWHNAPCHCRLALLTSIVTLSAGFPIVPSAIPSLLVGCTTSGTLEGRWASPNHRRSCPMFWHGRIGLESGWQTFQWKCMCTFLSLVVLLQISNSYNGSLSCDTLCLNPTYLQEQRHPSLSPSSFFLKPPGCTWFRDQPLCECVSTVCSLEFNRPNCRLLIWQRFSSAL